MNFSSPWTVLYNRETRVETCFERVPAPERFFPPKSHRFAFKLQTSLERRPIRKGQSARRFVAGT